MNDLVIKLRKEDNKMSETFIERMDKLKEHTKINHFQYEHLLCLNAIVSSLVSIDDSLHAINQQLRNIVAK